MYISFLLIEETAMSKTKAKSIVKTMACNVMNDWLRARGYEIPYYDGENANFTIVMLAKIITALNYSPKVRKKYTKQYKIAKMLYKQVHISLREWEIENCREVKFEDFPSEILRREVQDEVNSAFYDGFPSIEKYLENLDISLTLTIGRNKKKKKRK